jgi:hypothetical protein
VKNGADAADTVFMRSARQDRVKFPGLLDTLGDDLESIHA